MKIIFINENQLDIKYKVFNCQEEKHFKIYLLSMKISHISRYEIKQSLFHYSIWGEEGRSTFCNLHQFPNQYECEFTFHHGLLAEVIRGHASYFTGKIAYQSTNMTCKWSSHTAHNYSPKPTALFCSPNGFSNFTVILLLYFLLTASNDNFIIDQQTP